MDIMEISNPDDLGDIANLGLTLTEAKQLLARVQREISAAQAKGVCHPSRQGWLAGERPASYYPTRVENGAMRCIECDAADVSERRERTTRGYRRFRCRACGKQLNGNRCGGATYKFCARVEMMSSVAD